MRGRLRATRRGFLGLAAAASALAALGPLDRRALGRAPGGAGLRTFRPDEAEILTQVVERMVASDDPAAPAVRRTDAVATIDRLCARLDPGLQRSLRILPRLVDYGPIVFELRLRRFTRMGTQEKDASLRGWLESRFAWRRAGFTALRNLAFLGYYTQDATWPVIGYLGPLLGREGGSP